MKEKKLWGKEGMEGKKWGKMNGTELVRKRGREGRMNGTRGEWINWEKEEVREAKEGGGRER